jgi:hypothetical protein
MWQCSTNPVSVYSQEIEYQKYKPTVQQVYKPKRGYSRARGEAGRGVIDVTKYGTQNDNNIFFRKPKIIHPGVAKCHKMFEDNNEKIQDMKSLSLKRKLKFAKNNSYLIEKFSRDTESNP